MIIFCTPVHLFRHRATPLNEYIWSQVERLKHEDDTSNMSCNLKYSAWIAKRVA